MSLSILFAHWCVVCSSVPSTVQCSSSTLHIIYYRLYVEKEFHLNAYMSTQYHSAEQYLGNNRRDAVMITIKVMEVDERK